MDTLTITKEEVLLSENYSAEESSVKVSEAELRSIDEGLEEAKKGIFISHNEVMKGLRELIENWKNGKSNDYLVAKS